MTEDVGTTPRKPLSPRDRLAMWERHKGICVTCKMKIDGVREKWIDEHVIPLGLGGSNDLSNRGPAHLACAKVKTQNDVKAIAKSKRVKQRHLGIKKQSSFQTAKTGKYKQRMDGTLVWRATGKPVNPRTPHPGRD